MTRTDNNLYPAQEPPAPGTLTASLHLQEFDQPLLVTSFSGSEALSRLYQFQIELLIRDAQAEALDSMLLKTAYLTLDLNGTVRHIHGHIARVDHQAHGGGRRRCSILLVPATWLLQDRINCRVFQNKPLEKIIGAILKGIPHQVRLKGNQPLPIREYCVQYLEDDWSFVARLLEEEGLYYYFSHTRHGHKLHIVDSNQFTSAIEGNDQVLFHPPGSGQVETEDYVFMLQLSEHVRPVQAVVGDYNFTTSALDLTSKPDGSEDEKNRGGEIYDYPGKFTTTGQGKRLARIRLEEARCDEVQAVGRSICPRLEAGRTFSMRNLQPALPGEGRLLIREVFHQARSMHAAPEGGPHMPVQLDTRLGAVPQAEQNSPPPLSGVDVTCSYQNTFSGHPAAGPFRPSRVTPKPRIPGPQSAIVVGPDREELYVDKYGRVKVQFFWDRLGKRNKHSSCWVRVVQSVAGPARGAVITPRIGQEVLVTFLDGDPDRPVVTGALHNNVNPPPLNLPDEKTRTIFRSQSTPRGDGYSEVMIEDLKGQELIHVRGEKDLDLLVRNDMSTTVGRHQTIKVASTRTSQVGKREVHSVGKPRAKGGEGPALPGAGNEIRLVEVHGAAKETVHDDKETRVGGGLTVSVTGSVRESSEKNIVIEAVKEISIIVGKSQIRVGPDGIVIESKSIILSGEKEVVVKSKVIRLN